MQKLTSLCGENLHDRSAPGPCLPDKMFKKENHSISRKGFQNKRSEVPTELEMTYFSWILNKPQ